MLARRLFAATTVGLVLFVLLGGQLQAQETPQPWRFGVIEAHEAPNAARDLQTGWTRFTFQWADVQADGPDTWQAPLSDAQIEAQLAEGRDVVGLLIGIPDWARDEDLLPAGLWLEPDDPDNLWAAYVREAVSRYAGRIDHWIIWNEPDIDPTAVAHTWDGTVSDFYQLQRIAYLVAKENNPDAIIHLAAFTYWADVDAGREQYMARLLDRIQADPQAAEHNYYFDVATAHLYFQAEQVYDLLLLFRTIMTSRGMSKPIWLVETNAPPYNDPAWPVPDPTLIVTETEQAAYMSQGLTAALAAGAERIGVFKLRDTETDRAANPEPFGLLRLDGSRRPAFATLKVATQQMRGVQQASRERWDEVGQFRLDQADRRTTVLFARLPSNQIVEVEALADSAMLINMWGEAQQIEAENGRYVIELQSALCTQTIGDYCMIGGTTLYLVEAKDGGPPPTGPASLLSAPPVAPTLPVIWTPTATETPLPSPTSTPLPSATATAVLTATPFPTATASVTASPSQAPSSTAPAPTTAPRPTDTPANTGAGSWIAPLLVLGGLLLAGGIYWQSRRVPHD